MKRTDLRNIAIIAHVDHGKTTLVDQMMRQSGLFRSEELDRLVGGQHGLILDSNDLERERGITILAKNIALTVAGTKINIIDTPGHADFGGEVERVLKMADGCLLLVDAAEGPLPQTRFVLRKAFDCGLRPIVVINKIDRPDARPMDVLNEVFDLFVALDADEATLDFPTIYAAGRDGIATTDLSIPAVDFKPLFDAILKYVPTPEVDMDAPLQMLTISLDYSDYVGRIAIGRVNAGTIRRNQRVAIVRPPSSVGQAFQPGRVGPPRQAGKPDLQVMGGKRIDVQVKQLYTFDRLGRIETDQVTAGDICAVVGLEQIDIGDTIADIDNPVALPPITIDEPTLDMLFRINDSPFVGQEGTYVTSRQLRDRLMKELQSNVALRVVPSEEKRDEFYVSGRGLLHLSILIETMRREGFELSVGKPRVIYREKNGQTTEPIEYLVIDVPTMHVGAVMELVGYRKAECLKLETRADQSHVEFTIPARGLIGLRTRLLNATSGQAIMHHTFYDYQPTRGPIPGRANGVLVSIETGRTTAYALDGKQDRGTLFVGAGENVYEGQIVGEHCRDNDLPVNICQEKKLTNMRASGSDKSVILKPPRQMTLELALEYIEDNELVEITPTAIRLRKMYLKENERKKQARHGAG
ncbi:MAG: GTP-binding protein [Planctomycetes bacterium]|nr:GTP-binding protein [Planctomycetota bacterium]